MSKEIIVILVDEVDESSDIDGQPAQVFMRFYEPCDPDFLRRLANENPGKRVYELSGASSWYSSRP